MSKNVNFINKNLEIIHFYIYICTHNAKVAQLVELQPSKLVVASSSLVFRSLFKPQNFILRFFIL